MVAGSNRQDRPVSLFSFQMRKKITDIEFEHSMAREKLGGFVFCTRFSKDPDSAFIFAGGAGKNEFKCFDNDSE